MKIYHTETQENYDALMVELDRQGCKWVTGDKTTELTGYWKVYSSETCVKVCKKVVTYYKKSYYTSAYPSVQIIKYKEKADDKMRFTKENVYRLLGDYRINKNGIRVLAHLESAIIDLDDTPEKVAVPKFVAEWIEFNKEHEVSLQYLLRCYDAFYRCYDAFYIGNDPDDFDKWLDAEHWYVNNPYKFIQAYEEGYTIEPEPLYYIPLPHLETSDGIQQVLSKRENGKNYFASRPQKSLQQRFTKEELARAPETYKPFAKLIEGEE